MYEKSNLTPPFFEIGPKAFFYGDELLNLAIAADRASEKYRVDIILTPQPADIRLLSENTENIFIYAQHMDPLNVGEGNGSILPEAIKDAGASGVMLNHAEKPMKISDINKAIKRADEVELASLVCSDTPEEAAAIAHFSPNIIVAEPTELIGTGRTSSKEYVKETTSAIKNINSEILVLQGAGISNGKDVYEVIKSGSEGTGSTSGIMKAENPEAMIDEMVGAVRRAWDELYK